jgi:hypothetical protein
MALPQSFCDEPGKKRNIIRFCWQVSRRIPLLECCIYIMYVTNLPAQLMLGVFLFDTIGTFKLEFMETLAI